MMQSQQRRLLERIDGAIEGTQKLQGEILREWGYTFPSRADTSRDICSETIQLLRSYRALLVQLEEQSEALDLARRLWGDLLAIATIADNAAILADADIGRIEAATEGGEVS